MRVVVSVDSVLIVSCINECDRYLLKRPGHLLRYIHLHFVHTEIRCKDPEKEGVLSTQVSTHSVGGVAHYSCPRGFYMEGNETRICLQNGSWSGSTPACFCNYTCRFNLL